MFRRPRWSSLLEHSGSVRSESGRMAHQVSYDDVTSSGWSRSLIQLHPTTTATKQSAAAIAVCL